jgi:hypothetical protein
MTSKSNLNGTKFLLAAGALAGTVGGWILLSLLGGAGGQGNAVVQNPAGMDWLSQPLPTLIQANGQTSGSASVSTVSVDLQPIAQPTLRSVADQPAPAAVTQSSR